MYLGDGSQLNMPFSSARTKLYPSEMHGCCTGTRGNNRVGTGCLECLPGFHLSLSAHNAIFPNLVVIWDGRYRDSRKEIISLLQHLRKSRPFGLWINLGWLRNGIGIKHLWSRSGSFYRCYLSNKIKQNKEIRSTQTFNPFAQMSEWLRESHSSKADTPQWKLQLLETISQAILRQKCVLINVEISFQ